MTRAIEEFVSGGTGFYKGSMRQVSRQKNDTFGVAVLAYFLDVEFLSC